MGFACRRTPESGRADTAPGTMPLEGTQWIVSSLNGRALVDGSRITLAFADSTVGGYAGCNWYGTRYSVSGSNIRFEMAESTARGCMDPPGVGEQEAAYLAALRRVVTHRVAGDRLELLDRDESVIVSMTPRARAAMDPADLAGTRWRLRSVNDTMRAADSLLTLELSATEISGFAGCRRYTGTYGARGDEIGVTSLTMETTECDSGRVALLREGEFTTDLSEATTYRLLGDSLELNTVGGRRLVFTARRWTELPPPSWQIVARRAGVVLLAARPPMRASAGRGEASRDAAREYPTLVFENGRITDGPTARADPHALGEGPRDTLRLYSLGFAGGRVVFPQPGEAPPLLESPTRPGVYVVERDDRLWLLDDSGVVRLTADTVAGIARDTLRLHTREAGPHLFWAATPLWNPDGSAIAYVTNRTWMLARPSGQEIWLADIAAGRERPLLSERGEFFSPMGWLGSELVHGARRPGIFTVDVRTGRRRTIAIGTAEAFSRQGTRLMYTTTENGRLRAHVIEAGEVIHVPDPPPAERLDHGGMFSPSGDRLVLGTSFMADSGITRALYVFDIDARRLTCIVKWNLREGSQHPQGIPEWLDDSTLLVTRAERRTGRSTSAMLRVPLPR
jgi:heat shock protein HslJ